MTTPFPLSRPRRLRRDDFSRRLVREHALSVNDLIYPVFVLEGENRREPVASMPGVERMSLDLLLNVAQECVNLGIPVMALFPVISSHLKTPDGKEATNPQGLIPHVVATLKKNFPSLGIMTDIALDPYTSHGQDGIPDTRPEEEGYILNDETTRMLVPEDRYDEVKSLAQAAIAKFTLGASLDEGSRLGPLVSAAQRDRVIAFIQQGLAEGAELVAGGPDKLPREMEPAEPRSPGHGGDLVGPLSPQAQGHQKPRRPHRGDLPRHQGPHDLVGLLFLQNLAQNGLLHRVHGSSRKFLRMSLPASVR